MRVKVIRGGFFSGFFVSVLLGSSSLFGAHADNSLFLKKQKNKLNQPVAELKDSYRPYVEIGGVKYLNRSTGGAGVYDLFLPLWQTKGKLFFSNLRIFDRSGSSFEGNAHFGYRYLISESKQLVGLYASFDRRRSPYRHYFNQFMLGGEYWENKWFLGGNFYQPLGRKKRSIGRDSKTQEIKETRQAILFETTTQEYSEKSLSGFDLEIGYALIESHLNYLTGYVGVYLFQDGLFISSNKREASTLLGPKLRLTYDHHAGNRRKMLGIFDKTSLEWGFNMTNQEEQAAILH